MGLRALVDAYGQEKTHFSHRGSNIGQFSSHRLAVPATLSFPLYWRYFRLFFHDWLRHCVTTLEVVGRIEGGDTGIFSLTIILPDGKGGRCVGLTNLPPSCEECLQILGDSNSWNLKGPFKAVMGLLSGCLYLLWFAWNNLLYITKRSIIIEYSGTANLQALQ